MIRRSCSAGILTLCVDETGDYYPCAALCRRTPILARAATDTLPEAQARIREWIRRKFTVDEDPACRGCDFRYICGGGCRAISGDLQGRDRACELVRGRLERTLGKIIDPRKGMGKLAHSGRETAVDKLVVTSEEPC
jgi:radical SAM protein with 4Fe4S-binding SPASM domain